MLKCPCENVGKATVPEKEHGNDAVTLPLYVVVIP